MFQLNRSIVLNGAQLAVNVLLASWLILEYVHNRFMQEYVDTFWAANGVILSSILGGVAIVVGALIFFSRRYGIGVMSSPMPAMQEAGTAPTVTPLDVCPYCNVDLKMVSENRYQCRQCKRFFKK